MCEEIGIGHTRRRLVTDTKLILSVRRVPLKRSLFESVGLPAAMRLSCTAKPFGWVMQRVADLRPDDHPRGPEIHPTGD